MTALPAITLVTPSLNQGRFIRATIESVLLQGYPALEYVVQDGGSTDGTLAILDEYAGRISIVSEPDRGQSDALNRALSRARGEVLGYLNSDDLLRPGALRAVGEAFAAEPGALLVFGRAVYVDEEGRAITPYLTRAEAFERLADSCFVAQPAAFFRRRVWEEVGPFDVTLHHTMDYDYWFRFVARYGVERVRHLDRELAACRLHPGAKSVAGWGRGLDEIFDLVRRRTGHVSLWWCVAKWDHRLDGRSQAIEPHRIPWAAWPLALTEFLRQNPLQPAVWWRTFRGAGRALVRRLR